MVVRGVSSGTSGGCLNFMVSIVELAAAVAGVVVSFFVFIFVIGAVMLLIFRKKIFVR
jgi:hypothetical protein